MPARDVYADLAKVAGTDDLLALAQIYVDADEPVKALHVLEIVLAGDSDNAVGLELRQEALAALMARAENGLRNDYEMYWLKARLADTASRLAAIGS